MRGAIGVAEAVLECGCGEGCGEGDSQGEQCMGVEGKPECK